MKSQLQPNSPERDRKPCRALTRAMSTMNGMNAMNATESDKFLVALQAKLEDVQVHCKSEVSRLKREVSRLHEENADLRHGLARASARREETELEKDKSVIMGSESPELGRDASMHSELHHARNAVDLAAERRSKQSVSSSPMQRRKHFARTSAASSRTSTPNQEALNKYQVASKWERREDRAHSCDVSSSPSKAAVRKQEFPKPQQELRSNKRHQSAPQAGHQTRAPEVRLIKPAEIETELNKHSETTMAPQCTPPSQSFLSPRPSQDGKRCNSQPPESSDLNHSSSQRSVSEAAALAVEMVGKRKVHCEDSQKANESDYSDDDDAKSGCSENSALPVKLQYSAKSTEGTGSAVAHTRSSNSSVPAILRAAIANGIGRQASKSFVECPSRDSGYSATFFFEPLVHWRTQVVRRKRFAKTRRSVDVCKQMHDIITIQENRDTRASGCCIRFIAEYLMTPPTTLRCILFDLMGVALIAYELIFLPLQVFDLPQSLFFKVFDWIQRIFWTFAIVRSFFVGYVKQDGSVELRPSRVAKNYICSWLPFDLFFMAFDWVEVVMGGAEFVSAARVTKTVRFTRIIRIFRLARMAKLPRLLEDFDARFISEKTILLLGIVKITILFVTVGHMLACFWYGLGRYWGYDGRSWVEQHNVLDESTAYQYMTSLHWALSQFQGSMEVMPVNTYERNYAAWVLVFTFVSASVFVSRITAAYTRLQIIAGGNERKFSELRTFLQANNISSSLAMRVMRSAQFSVSQSIRQMAEEDIELLASITEPLRIEIHYEIFRPHLTVHPFFRWINHAHGGAMRHLCQSAIQVLAVSQGDLLFSEGQEAMNPRMFFVMSGALTYNCDLDEVAVSKGTWFSEGTLWLQWVHVGDLLAYSEGQICALRADSFQETIFKFHDLAEVCVKYAAAFVKKLNTCPPAICDLHRGYVVEELMEHALSSAPTFGPRSSGSMRLSWRGTKSTDPTCIPPDGYDDFTTWTPNNNGNTNTLGQKIFSAFGNGTNGRRMSAGYSGRRGSNSSSMAVIGQAKKRLSALMMRGNGSPNLSPIAPDGAQENPWPLERAKPSSPSSAASKAPAPLGLPSNELELPLAVINSCPDWSECGDPEPAQALADRTKPSSELR